VVGDWPLVGRDDELRVAAAILLSHSAGLAITGAPGVGKSRLAQEVERAASGTGLKTEWVIASRSGGSVAFGAFAHPLPAGGARVTQLDLLLRIRDTITRRAGAAQLLICVDDVDLLDAGSTALIHTLATRRTAKLLLTMRSGAAVSPPIAALWNDGTIEHQRERDVNHEQPHEQRRVRDHLCHRGLESRRSRPRLRRLAVEPVVVIDVP
jgi:hypothetical protein